MSIPQSGAPRQVLIAAAECMPLAKTGGLADVVGALPQHLRAQGWEARVILPYHHCIKDKYASRVTHLHSFSVDLGWRSQYVGLEKLVLNDVVYYLIDNEYYFGDRIYRGGNGEGEQYAFFTRAVLEALPLLDFSPELLHVNDWHTAMIPMLLSTQYQRQPQGRLRTLLTIHNLAYQGQFSLEFASDLLSIGREYWNSQMLECRGAANFLKAGCVFADKLNTVSPTYAREIRNDYFGEGLDGVLNARGDDLSGVLNGLDYQQYDPATDAALPTHFSLGDMSGKARVKQALLTELGLSSGARTPLLAMVTRLTSQKGLDLLLRMLDELLLRDLSLVVVGTGDPAYEDALRSAEFHHKGRMCAYLAYNEDLAHRVYAGADFLLMPSRFEPCGLSQLIAMRYGCLPIVRETGGLKDTVRPYNKYTGEGTGFSFTNYNAHEMADAVYRALDAYHEPIYSQLVRQAMNADFSFDRTAAAYAALYASIVS